MSCILQCRETTAQRPHLLAGGRIRTLVYEKSMHLRHRDNFRPLPPETPLRDDQRRCGVSRSSTPTPGVRTEICNSAAASEDGRSVGGSGKRRTLVLPYGPSLHDS